MKYRAEIDGLRALAIVPVILYHAGFGFFSGGFLGVDVFFVISGYLITKIIYEQCLKGEFSFIQFYDRRVRRIIPPLLATALLTIGIASTFSPADIKNVGQSLVATFTFLSNYFFYLETDYFNPFNQNAPMLHTWSLSVEEQFYIFFPFLLVIFAKTTQKYVILISLALLSFYGAVQLTEQNPSLSFYSFHTRGWEFLLGSLIAVYETNRAEQFQFNHKFLIESLVLVAILALLASVIFLTKQINHPSWWTLVPVFSTGVIIFFGKYTAFAKSILSNRLFVSIGLISYALYLFHNPIFSAIKYHADAENVAVYKLLSLPLIVALSYLSYRYIEKPSRNKQVLKAIVIHPAILSCVMVTLVVGFVAHKKEGFLTYFSTRLVENGGVPLVDVEAEKTLVSNYRVKYYPSDTDFYCDISGGCTNILIFGDSFAEDAFLALSYLEDPSMSVRKVYFDDECMRDMNESDFHTDTVCFDEDVSFDLIDVADVILVTAKWQESTYKNGLKFTKALKQYSQKPVFITGSVMFEDLSSFSFKTQGLVNNDSGIARLAYSNMRFDRLRISDSLKALVDNENDLIWIEKSEFFCDRNKQTCDLFVKEGPIIWDNAHLTVRGYTPYANFLLDSMNLKNAQARLNEEFQ